MNTHIDERTTILVAKKTQEQLRSLRRRGETYDDVIIRLLKKTNRQEFIIRQYKRLEEKDKFILLEGI